MFMAGYWLMLYLAYFLAPIEQAPPVSTHGLVFVVSMVLLFGFAAACGGIGSPARRDCDGRPPLTDPQTTARTFLIIGIVGAFLHLYDKVAALELVGLLGAAELRAERALALLEAGQHASGILSGMAFLCYPAGLVGVVAVLLTYESQQRTVRTLAVVYILSLFLHSVAAGGRGTIFVTFLLIAVCLYLRRCAGLRPFPRSPLLAAMFGGLGLLFVVYSAVIWKVRASMSDLGIEEFLQHAELNWEVTPTQSLTDLAATLQEPALVQVIMSSVFYFTQSLSVIERILAMTDIPVMLGGYQVDIVAALLRLFPAGAVLLGSGNALLLEANVYGFFTSAWGALVIDFGWPGALAACFVWGWVAGRSHRWVRSEWSTPALVFYAFWMYSVLISFVSPPLGFANSAVTLFWFVALVILTRGRKPAPVALRTREARAAQRS